MGLRIQRLLAPARALEPGQYTLETASGRPAICCKSCGTIAELPATHRILTGGLVAPIWTCEQPTCGASEFLVLGDSDEDVLQ